MAGIPTAGGYLLSKVLIKSNVSAEERDITLLVKGWEVYEDIFSQFITANLFIEDAFNLPEILPIRGQETVTIVFSRTRESSPITLLFATTELTNNKFENGVQKYKLNLMSQGGYLNFTQTCGYSVKGKIKKIIETIFNNHFPDFMWKDKLEIDDTEDKYSFILSMSHTPFESISWLANKAKSSLPQYPYFFYETISGYNFKNLSTMLLDSSDKKIYTYTYTPTNPLTSESKEKTVKYEDIILSLEVLSSFNTPENILMGRVCSNLLVHDLFYKQQRVSTFKEKDDVSTKTKLAKEPFWKTEDPISDMVGENGVLYYLPATSNSVFTKENEIVNNNQVENIYLANSYHKLSILTKRIVVTIHGDETKRVGTIFNMDINNLKLSNKELDKNLTGKYLITAVKHVFSGFTYTTVLELSTNSMGV